MIAKQKSRVIYGTSPENYVNFTLSIENFFF